MLEIRLLIRRIDLAMRRQGGELLSTYGLTASQAELLYHLQQIDGAEQHVLAERLGITKASLSSLIDGIEELGLVKRCPRPEDARTKQIFLTEQGKDLLGQMKNVALQWEAQMHKGFSGPEIELLKDWLERLARNLDDS